MIIEVSKSKPNTLNTLSEAMEIIALRRYRGASIPDEELIDLKIDEGIYKEKVHLRGENIRITGAGADKTFITYDDGAKTSGKDGKPIGTFKSFTMLISGKNILLRDLTIQNTSGPGTVNGQAVAAFVTADRCTFLNCKFLGHQDTLYCGSFTADFMDRIGGPDYFHNSQTSIYHEQAQNYLAHCYIEGDVDYIFGSSMAYFDRCTIHTKKLASEDKAYITAANTPIQKPFGFIFNHCTIQGSSKTDVYLGRPWRNYAKTIFHRCHMDDSIHPEGWENWGRPEAELTLQYIEIDNIGPGAGSDKRAKFVKLCSHNAYQMLLAPENLLDDYITWLK